MIERNIQFLGILVALAVAGYSISRFRARTFRPLDLMIGLLFTIALVAVSLYPPLIDPFRQLMTVGNRWNFVFFVSVMLLFGLYLQTVNRVNDLRDQVSELVRSLARSEYLRARAAGGGGHIAVVIPAYNEERAIKGVLALLPDEVLGHRVEPIVVVDGASDDTEVVLRQSGYLVASHALNRGNPAAVRTGYEIALRQGAEVVVTLDADGQHDPTEMARLTQPIWDDEADYVLGSRFMGHYEEAGGMRHRGVVFFSSLIRLLSGLPVNDCTNGFRAFRADSLRKLELHEPRFIGPELLFEASRKGLRFRHVPVTVRSRRQGESKMPRHIYYPLSFLWTIVRVWLR